LADAAKSLNFSVKKYEAARKELNRKKEELNKTVRYLYEEFRPAKTPTK